MDSLELKPLLVGRLPKLRRFARTLTGDAADADDLLQDACLRAFEKAGDLEDVAKLDGWMFRILRNTWISETRRRKTRQGEGTVDAEDTDELHSKDDGEAHVSAGEIRDQILGLPEGLASVLLLVSIEGYSYREAAEILDIPLGTVMSRLSRARRSIADALGHEVRGSVR